MRPIPQHTDSALYPIIGQMERAAGFAHDDTVQAKLDKLDAVLALGRAVGLQEPPAPGTEPPQLYAPPRFCFPLCGSPP
jgi:hypothetical protein